MHYTLLLWGFIKVTSHWGRSQRVKGKGINFLSLLLLRTAFLTCENYGCDDESRLLTNQNKRYFTTLNCFLSIYAEAAWKPKSIFETSHCTQKDFQCLYFNTESVIVKYLADCNSCALLCEETYSLLLVLTNSILVRCINRHFSTLLSQNFWTCS